MTEVVRVNRSDGVATITIDNPPVNALGHAVRKGLLAALEAAWSDPDVRAIVLCAAGRTWPAGADIREFGKPPGEPSLPALCRALSKSRKPVVVALHGNVLGGGLELALVAGLRIARPGTQLGLPEVSLGILPGGGGTQRLPRLIGAKPALGMMLTGLPITAERAGDLGLVDVLADDPDAAADRAARAWIAGEADLPLASERKVTPTDAEAWLSAVAEARRGLGPSGRLPAPARIVDCVEAALLLPEDEGHAFERVAFKELLATPQSAALRHAFLAERRAQRPSGVGGASPREIEHVGVVGGGFMGAGIATALIGAGYKVTLLERDAEALAAGLARVATQHERAVEKGRLDPEMREEEWARIEGATQVEAFHPVDMVIEAAFEDEAVKSGILAELDRVVKPGAILATNTSYLDINRLADATSRPGDVIGLHFFSPVHAMKLIEVVVTDRTEPDVVATGFAVAKRLGKVAVRAGVCDGFIGNRMLTAYRTATDFLLEDGASPYEVDRAMVAFGFPLGPYQVLDMAGLDISWARRKWLAAARDPTRRYVAIGDRLCEAGRLGQKAGRGYYLYSEGGRKGVEDSEVLKLIEAERDAKGIVARPVSEREIQKRALAAMANEGARILEEKIAERPSDIDLVMMMGYGFPRWRGGPMLVADREDPLMVRDRLRDYAREDEWFWRPAPLWDELIKNGRTFDDLNAD
ncbi:Fatty acid oxidation complex subunit alpha [Defluviimonas aquaemixtae]|uniref:Fatty acid oxidation complex subunit alpha n=1 Tax=Albidovulum aquaemixtae TaxID=1542388 RepID=A0A2R8B485_9RHOB|nr:FAD-dependent oxidoreductase [Defluviimonas aquaemixtae]SPH17451.1 Fatty acid oxidation complex subunit alpha [Defluviimonas aquaemixtae]